MRGNAEGDGWQGKYARKFKRKARWSRRRKLASLDRGTEGAKWYTHCRLYWKVLFVHYFVTVLLGQLSVFFSRRVKRKYWLSRPFLNSTYGRRFVIYKKWILKHLDLRGFWFLLLWLYLINFFGLNLVITHHVCPGNFWGRPMEDAFRLKWWR